MTAQERPDPRNRALVSPVETTQAVETTRSREGGAEVSGWTAEPSGDASRSSDVPDQNRPEPEHGDHRWGRRRSHGRPRDEDPGPDTPLYERPVRALGDPADPMADPDDDGAPRQLHPLPPGLVELYGLLAVLFVLVPEWMAGGALFGFREGREGSELPPPSGAWKRLPELRLASLNLAELRQLARERGLIGYSRQSRPELTLRLLRHLKARP